MSHPPYTVPQLSRHAKQLRLPWYAAFDSGTAIKMRPIIVTLFTLLSLVSGDIVQDLSDKGRAQVDARIAKSKTCTKEKLQVRREWYVYLSCLSSRP